MRLRIVPYKKGSESAKLLAEALEERLGYHVWRGPIKARRRNILWGFHGNTGDFVTGRDINTPAAISVARDKLNTFRHLSGHVSMPPYTTDRTVVERWLNEGKTVLARTVLNGQGGAGIRILNRGDPIPDAPLYVEYVKKKKEFRVHVVGGAAVDVQEKRRRAGTDTNSMIRNHDNGWVFCHENIVEPAGLRQQAIDAVQRVGLEFGAVDCIWNERRNQVYVLEVNTAPGLAPSTAAKYAEAFLPYTR